MVQQKYITICFSTISAYAGYLIGKSDGIISALIMIIVIEYITSILDSIISKSFKLCLLRKSLLRYFYIFILVIVSHFFDKMFLGGADELRSCVALFYLSMESLIVINNASRMGLPIPEKLKNAIKLIEEKDNSNQGG